METNPPQTDNKKIPEIIEDLFCLSEYFERLTDKPQSPLHSDCSGYYSVPIHK